jgi:tryptophan 2,3-dioxygenase
MSSRWPGSINNETTHMTDTKIESDQAESDLSSNTRGIEDSIHTDFKDEMSYADYLKLDQLLSAQTPMSGQHDEMLFIIIHQSSELWLKLASHEINRALGCIRVNDFGPAFKVISRVKHIFIQLTQSWNILSTLTPSDYLEFRDDLGHSSGFQSAEYRKLEFLLGNKNKDMLKVHQSKPDTYQQLDQLLKQPCLYDEVIRALVRAGFDIDESHLNRDFTQAYTANASVLAAWLSVYQQPKKYFELYELAEKLVDIEDAFQQWRFKHMYTVQRIIGNKQGTGGSSGVTFLKRALDVSFFPELFEVRTHL